MPEASFTSFVCPTKGCVMISLIYLEKANSLIGFFGECSAAEVEYPYKGKICQKKKDYFLHDA